MQKTGTQVEEKDEPRDETANIDFLMNMTKAYLDGKIDSITYSFDFPHELEQRYKKAHREDDDFCELIYQCLL